MNPTDTGMPPIALLQLLEHGTLGPTVTSELLDIMTREGVDLELLIRRGEQIPLRWFREVYPGLDVDRATIVGLSVAGEAQLTTFGALTLPLISAGSVADVVELLAYLPIISTALHPQVQPSDGGLTIGLSGHTNDAALDSLVVAYGGYALLRLLDMLTGPVPDLALRLNWPAPASLPPEQIPDGRIGFGAPASYVHIPAGRLDEVCRFSDPVAYRVSVDNLGRALAARSGRASTTEQVTRLVERDPASAGIQAVALDMALSVSTLKRRLAHEGTTFRQLQQSVLQARATLRLLDTSLPVSEIAAELGYSDVANFSHAFKRWTGRSPREFQARS